MKKIVSLLMISILILSFININGFAKTQYNRHKIKLEVDNSTEALKVYSNESFKKGNKYYLGYNSNNHKKVFLNMNLSLNNENNNTHGTGVLKLDNKTLPFDFKGRLNKYELKDGHNVYYGPQYVDIKVKGESTKSVIGLFYNPNTNEYIASITIGTLQGEKGVSYLSFGEITQEYKELTFNINKKDLETQENKKLDESHQANNNFTLTTNTSEPAQTKYKYIGKSYSTQMYHDEYGMETRDYANNWIGYIQVHNRGPELAGGNVCTTQVRVFSNTGAVEEEIKSETGSLTSTAIVENVKTRFGFDQSSPVGGIDIYNSYPADSGTVDHYDYLSYIPKVGKWLQLAANVSEDLRNSNPDIYSSVIRSELNRTVELEKTVDHLWNTSTDHNSSDPTAIPGEEDTTGTGITFQFDWFEHMDGYGYMYAETEILYHASNSANNSLYNGYFWTDPIIVMWQENFYN